MLELKHFKTCIWCMWRLFFSKKGEILCCNSHAQTLENVQVHHHLHHCHLQVHKGSVQKKRNDLLTSYKRENITSCGSACEMKTI